jgi:hypothetical protein
MTWAWLMFVHVNEVKTVRNLIVDAIGLESIAVASVDALTVKIDPFYFIVPFIRSFGQI